MKLAQKNHLAVSLGTVFFLQRQRHYSDTVNTAHPLSRHDLPVITSVHYTFNLGCNHLIHR